MLNFNISPHFKIAELVSKEVLTKFGASSTWFIDPRIITLLEFLRNRFGVTHVNNWIDGGDLDSRGFRSLMDSTGATYSQHRYGRAVDCSFNIPAQEVREDIKLNWNALYKPLGITTIEDNVNWCHADMRYIPDQTELFIIYP